MTIDDLKSRKELLRYEGHEELEDFIFNKRDQRIIDAIGKQLELGADGRLGLLYGAAHMGCIVNFLYDQHGFKVIESEWLTVFSY